MTGTTKAIISSMFLVFTIVMGIAWAFFNAIIFSLQEEINTIGVSFNLTSYIEKLASQSQILSFGWRLFWTLWNNIPILLFGFLLFILLIIAFNQQTEEYLF